MEVHAHSHSHGKKNWKQYFWEFLMLFLAVFCGFLAENFREHQVEHQREKQYMRSLLNDLAADTATLHASYPRKEGRIKAIDVSLLFSGITLTPKRSPAECSGPSGEPITTPVLPGPISQLTN